MTTTKTTNYSGSIYYCPYCNKNDKLFHELVVDKTMMLYAIPLNRSTIVDRFFCENCKCDIIEENINIIKKTVYKIGSQQTTIEKESWTEKNTLFTTTKTTINYNPAFINEKHLLLYYDMLFMLIDYIETHQTNINVENNKFYKLALEHTSLNSNDFSNQFEEQIIAKFKVCIVKFTTSELNKILQNSLNVLEGEVNINNKIYKMYYALFNLIKIGNLNHGKYFQSLRR